MDLTRFKDTEKGILFSNFKKYKALSIYDTLDEESLNYVLDNMYSIKQDAIEITIDKNDKKLLKSVQDAGFKPIYDWFIFDLSSKYNDGVDLDNIVQIKNRRKVKKMLTEQVHELAKRMPEMFDKNGEEKGWYKAGDICIAYIEEEKIVSLLTYSFESKTNNIHIFLTYTIPQKRSLGYGGKLIDYVKNIAIKNNVSTITVCTDVSSGNRVPNMFYKNGFKYFKTGYEKILKQKK